MFVSLVQRIFLVEDWLYGVFMAQSLRAYRLAGGVLLVLVLVTMGLLFSTGAAPQRIGSPDTFFLLDYTWRFVCGQRPHSDFYDFLGITSVLPPAVGMLVCGRNCAALAYGPAMFLPVLTLGAWRIAKQRFSAFIAAMVAALVGGTIVGTFPLTIDADWRTPSYAMQYNRFQWALLSLLVLLVLVRPRQVLSRAAGMLEGTVAGLLIGLLLVGKVNYLTGAVAIVGMGILIPKSSRGFWLACLAAIAVIALSYVFWLRGDLAAVRNDYAMLFAAQKPAYRIGLLRLCAGRIWPDLSIPVFILAVHLRRFSTVQQRDRIAPAAWFDILLIGVLFAVSFIVVTGNAEVYSIPVWALGCVLLAETLGSPAVLRPSPLQNLPRNCGEACRLRVCLGYLAATIAASCFIVPDFSSVAYAFVWKHYRSEQFPEDSRIDAKPLEGLILPPATYDPQEIDRMRERLDSASKRILTSYEYALFVNDGLKLLRDHTDAKSRVFCFDVYNPFPFALQLPDAKGTVASFDSQKLVDDTHHPPVSRMFGEVTHVMVPKNELASCDIKDNALLRRVCGAYLEEHFEPCGESKFWTLYARKHDRSNESSSFVHP